jgi:tetratricopeptide (TPR) repeat protein
MKTRPPREVIPVARRLIDYTQSRFGERSSEYALSLRNLAILLPSQGEFASALTLLLRALEICRETPGADHPSYGICLVDLAELQLLQGDRPQAKVLCEEALWIFRRTVGADHGLSARARNCLERVAAMEGADKGFGTISIMT